MKAVKKPIDPPKINPSLASYLQRPEVIAAAKKRMEAEKVSKARAYATPAKGNIKPSYPELTLIAAGQSLKAAKAIPTLLTKSTDKLKTDLGKAAKLFATDLIVGESIDYADEKRKKK